MLLDLQFTIYCLLFAILPERYLSWAIIYIGVYLSWAIIYIGVYLRHWFAEDASYSRISKRANKWNI